jgi:peptide/nickel transport system permease protein
MVLNAHTFEADMPAAIAPERISARRRRFSPVLWIAAGWLGLLILCALVVQWLPLHSYTAIVGRPNMPPNWGREFLGTDDIGRSMLSRLAYGARISIFISFTATLAALVVGSLLGLMAAYFRASFNVIADLSSNSLLSVPQMLLVLTIVLALGSSIPVITAAVSIPFIPAFMRLMRANAQAQLPREYIRAARGMGASHWRVLFKELLPNTAPALVSYAAIVLPTVMILEGSLSFLGFGVQPPTPSWGQMISLGAQNIDLAAWPVIIPCIVLSLTVFSLNTMGDYIRSRLSVGEQQL